MVNMIAAETLDDAMSIFKALLTGEEVSKKENSFLYDKYRYNSAVEELIGYLAEKFEVRIYAGNEKLFICPKVGSRLFGWSNEELKRKLRMPNALNSDLYLSYFIIMTLITMFYPEASPHTPIVYVKFNDLVEVVSTRMEQLIKKEDLESVTQDTQFDFVGICKRWQEKPFASEGGRERSTTRVGLVETACRLLDEEKLVVYDQVQKLLYPTERFNVIIWKYYEEKDNRVDLLSLIEGLEGDN